MLQKLKNLPEKRKKIIIWGAAVVIVAPILFFQVQGTKNKLENISFESSPFSSLSQEISFGMDNVLEGMKEEGFSLEEIEEELREIKEEGDLTKEEEEEIEEILEEIKNEEQ